KPGGKHRDFGCKPRDFNGVLEDSGGICGATVATRGRPRPHKVFLHPKDRVAPPAAPCRPRSHVVFLKTHKTGGSSVLNLLSRYGESRRLRFALPRRYQFGYPAPFRAERVRGFSAGGRKFDIICHHMRFNLSEVQRVMPNDSFYFSIVRRPGPGGRPAFRNSPSGNHYARNLQWFDFGLPEAAEPARVPALLGELERVFPLVLLAERFDESLVLLRHRLCWPRDAVDLFPLTAAPAPGCPRGSWAPLAPGTSLDWALSTHFNRSFWRGSAPGWSGCGAERPSCGGAAQRPGALCLQDKRSEIWDLSPKIPGIWGFSCGIISQKNLECDSQKSQKFHPKSREFPPKPPGIWGIFLPKKFGIGAPKFPVP
uniref:Uncharacterized protein n=1 Tax=Geospiza parvula TaxID=87175 RepID=A0A8U8BKV2_GEOPR